MCTRSDLPADGLTNSPDWQDVWMTLASLGLCQVACNKWPPQPNTQSATLPCIMPIIAAHTDVVPSTRRLLGLVTRVCWCKLAAVVVSHFTWSVLQNTADGWPPRDLQAAGEADEHAGAMLRGDLIHAVQI